MNRHLIPAAKKAAPEKTAYTLSKLQDFPQTTEEHICLLKAEP